VFVTNRWRLAFIVLLICGSAVDLWAGWALRHLDLSASSRVAVALVPLPANVALIAMVLRRIRALDEFQKRVHFEAAVAAFLATGVGVFIYGYLRQADAVAPLDAAWVWAFMCVAYAGGWGLAVRRYR
jgi:hypothetical protein